MQKLRKTLESIIYRCDLEHLFRSMKHEQSKHDKAKRARRANDVKLFLAGNAGKKKRIPKEQQLKGTLMLENFNHPSGSGSSFLSVKRKRVNMERLSDAMVMPETKRARVAGEDADDGDIVAMDLEQATEDERDPESDDIFFKVVLQNVGGKHRIQTSVAAGGMFSSNDLCVTVHKARPLPCGGMALDTQPLVADASDEGGRTAVVVMEL